MDHEHLTRWTGGPKMLSSLPRSITILCVITFVYMLGWSLIMPFLPLFFKEHVGSFTKIGLIFAAFPIFQILWSLVLGELLDKLSKRSVIGFVQIILLPMSTVMLSLATLTQFIWWQFYHAFTASAFWISSEAYVRSHSPLNREAETFGSWTFFVGLASVIGAIIGGILMMFIGFNVIYGVSIFSFLAFILIVTWLPDHTGDGFLRTLNTALKQGILQHEFHDLFENKPMLKLALFSMLFAFGASILAMILPLFLDNLGATFWQIGVISAAFHLPIMTQHHFAMMKNPHRIVTVGMICSTILFVLLFFVKSVFLTFFLAILLGLAFASVYPIMMGNMTKVMPVNKIGEFSAISYAFRRFGAAIGPILAGFLSDVYGLGFAFLLCGAVFGIMTLTLKRFSL